MPNRFFTAVALALVFCPVICGVDRAMASDPAPLTVKDLGVRHGQAIAAVRICPGARLTVKVATLGTNLTRPDLAVFRDESDRILTAWASAFSCRDVDPAQTREINGCRRAKILSCNQTWREIGPEGTELPGLIQFRPDDGGKDTPANPAP